MKRFFVIFATALIFLMAISVSASDVHAVSYAKTGYSIDADGVFLPDESGEVKTFELKTGMFSCGGDVLRRRIVSIGGISAVSVTLPTESLGGVLDTSIHGYTEISLVLTEIEDVYRTLAFGISISGSDGVPFTAELSLSAEEGEILSECTFTPREWTLICLDISEVRGSELLLKIRVPYTETTMPDTISVTAPYLESERHAEFEYIRKYLTTELVGSVGGAFAESGNIIPDENGDAVLTAELVSEMPLRVNTNAVLELRLSGITGGSLSLSVTESYAESYKRTTYNRISLDASDGIYAIPIDINGGISSYTLDFSDAECAGFFKLDSVKIYDGGDLPLAANSDIGTVSHIRMTERGVVFTGSMERGAVSEFSDGGIRYYAIPSATSDDITTAVMIGQTSTTTVFEYTADLSGLAISADTHMFFAAVEDAMGNILPLSSPRYFEAAEPKARTLSSMGLYNASAAGAFESNVSHIMLDIDLSTLITERGESDAVALGYTSPSGETKTVWLDREHVRALDRDIEFYVSAGINVYIRLISAAPVDGLTYSGENGMNYAVIASSRESAELYTAIVRYISERYPTVSGYSVGTGVNTAYKVGGADIFDISVYAMELAELCRITYNAASHSNPDVMVLVEFDEYKSDEEQVSDRTLGVAIARRLEEIGRIPWAFVYSINSAEDELDPTSCLASLLGAFDIDGAEAIMYFYDPMSDNLTYKYYQYLETLDRSEEQSPPKLAEYLAETFAALCSRASEYKARTVFMSLGDILQDADHEFYSSLKNTGLGNYDRHIEEHEAHAADEKLLSEMAGEYILWDFSDKFHNLEWISTGGVSSFTTEHSPIFSEANGEYSRVLRSSVDTVGAAGAAGLILRNLRGTVDLSGGVKLVFDFSVSGELDTVEDELTVVFVVGADDYRAEYDAGRVKIGETQTLLCDLGEYSYSSTVEYIGVIIYAKKSVQFDLSSVSVYSDKMTDGELYEIFSPTQSAAEGGLGVYSAMIVVTIMMAASAVVCILIVKRDREEQARAADK